MRKLLLLFSLIFALSLSAKETVKIGVVIPMSGQAAWLADDFRDSLKLQLLQLQEKNLKYEYTLLFEDSQNLPRLAAEAFKKLSEIDKVDAVLSFAGSPGAAISVLANNKGILHIGMGYSPAIATGPLNFNNCAKPETSVTLMLEYLNAAGLKRVAMINQVHASTVALEKEFEKQLPGSVITLVNVQKFTPGERDFRVSILKVREAKPDIVFIHAFDPEAAIIARQMKEINFNPPLSSMAHWGLAQGQEFSHIPWVEMSPNSKFLENFTAHYHRTPIYFAALMCDSLAMLVDSYESFEGTGKPNSTYIAQKLSAIRDFPGAMGKTTPDADGWFNGPAQIIFRDNKGMHTLTISQAVKMAKERWPSSIAK